MKKTELDIKKEINKVALYLLDNTDYYYQMAMEDAERMLEDDKKEFDRILLEVKSLK